MKHSFTSVRLLNIEQPIRHGHAYDNDKRRGIHVDLSPPQRGFQPLFLTFGPNPLTGFIFVDALSAYQNIGGFIGAASVEPPAVSSAI